MIIAIHAVIGLTNLISPESSDKSSKPKRKSTLDDAPAELDVIETQAEKPKKRRKVAEIEAESGSDTATSEDDGDAPKRRRRAPTRRKPEETVDAAE
ncbi:hypothetical protein AB8615_00575 [Litorimonas sp. RW-G-Af-16]|uniref:hypothetical protein n=1 Tax=Litorimonas sp. RW-G-Af-16 TaxID=3241168 RepID=UPI003AABD956